MQHSYLFTFIHFHLCTCIIHSLIWLPFISHHCVFIRKQNYLWCFFCFVAQSCWRNYKVITDVIRHANALDTHFELCMKNIWRWVWVLLLTAALTDWSSNMLQDMAKRSAKMHLLRDNEVAKSKHHGRKVHLKFFVFAQIASLAFLWSRYLITMHSVWTTCTLHFGFPRDAGSADPRKAEFKKKSWSVIWKTSSELVRRDT